MAVGGIGTINIDSLETVISKARKKILSYVRLCIELDHTQLLYLIY